jgi:hypothetical protein
MNKPKEAALVPPSGKKDKTVGLLYFVSTIIFWLVYADGQLGFTLGFLMELLGGPASP